MKILAKTQNDEYYNRLPLPSQVKRLGKYLKDNLSGVYKITEPPNEYIIYTTVLYTIKEEVRKEIADHIQHLMDLYAPYTMPPEVRKEIEDGEKILKEASDTVYDMNIYLNITTYSQYIRVNVIRLDQYEQTLGYMRLEPKELISLPFCKDKIVRYVKKVIEKKYKDDGYEVLI
jgi:hypothetical protein